MAKAELASQRRSNRVFQKHVDEGAFDADDVQVLTEAFEQAWKAVQAGAVRFAPNGHAEATRELLALRIIEIAQLGERDPARLRNDALIYFARTNRESTGL